MPATGNAEAKMRRQLRKHIAVFLHLAEQDVANLPECIQTPADWNAPPQQAAAKLIHQHPWQATQLKQVIV